MLRTCVDDAIAEADERLAGDWRGRPPHTTPVDPGARRR
jgi:hypothetical protein